MVVDEKEEEEESRPISPQDPIVPLADGSLEDAVATNDADNIDSGRSTMRSDDAATTTAAVAAVEEPAAGTVAADPTVAAGDAAPAARPSGSTTSTLSDSRKSSRRNTANADLDEEPSKKRLFSNDADDENSPTAEEAPDSVFPAPSGAEPVSPRGFPTVDPTRRRLPGYATGKALRPATVDALTPNSPSSLTLKFKQQTRKRRKTKKSKKSEVEPLALQLASKGRKKKFVVKEKEKTFQYRSGYGAKKYGAVAENPDELNIREEVQVDGEWVEEEEEGEEEEEEEEFYDEDEYEDEEDEGDSGGDYEGPSTEDSSHLVEVR
ncbi:hypothetical protein PFISCL1PPCAC_14045 [Pristionchus fissidentatus]|uniref:Uncharacterized protein n=1 Tax=Pristionchus fissidentatus TaxID=1538716 RepID=A0AAV5VWK3_9BILA|nr:hypothetical protein PFISCL1PPCAC_14045 [Pristionchus fissidentatus]